MILTKLRRTVTANVCFQQILVVVIVVQTTEETKLRVPILVTVSICSTGCEVKLRILDIININFSCLMVFILISHTIHTEHSLEVVLVSQSKFVCSISIDGITLRVLCETIDTVHATTLSSISFVYQIVCLHLFTPIVNINRITISVNTSNWISPSIGSSEASTRTEPNVFLISVSIIEISCPTLQDIKMYTHINIGIVTFNLGCI